ncbi:hypothetical protein C4577_07490 [Candidatus Parcubacteria bacterium]|nr:MAG: hypothetical protein C4577_07490 [Candidatus Parcubacteria bacterium]
MPVYTNISVTPLSDFTVQTQVNPITAIGAWNIQFQVTNRAGGISGLITLSTNSGYINNVSGGTIVNSGNGIFSFTVSGGSMSGFQPGAYFYNIQRLGSGVTTELSLGYLLISY